MSVEYSINPFSRVWIGNQAAPGKQGTYYRYYEHRDQDGKITRIDFKRLDSVVHSYDPRNTQIYIEPNIRQPRPDSGGTSQPLEASKWHTYTPFHIRFSTFRLRALTDRYYPEIFCPDQPPVPLRQSQHTGSDSCRYVSREELAKIGGRGIKITDVDSNNPHFYPLDQVQVLFNNSSRGTITICGQKNEEPWFATYKLSKVNFRIV